MLRMYTTWKSNWKAAKRVNFYAKNTLEHFGIKWIYKKCGKIASYQQLEAHEKECDFKPTRCVNNGCTFIGVKTKVQLHLESCHFAIIRCKYWKYCKEIYLRGSWGKGRKIAPLYLPTIFIVKLISLFL